MTYGFGAFKEALNHNEQSRSERMKDLALAVRIGTNADDKTFRRFLDVK